MLLNMLLFALCGAVIVVSFILSRWSRDRPSVQLLCMPLIQIAIYSSLRRAWGIATGSNAIFLQDKPLLLFWLVLLVWPSWALYILWRQRRGEAFFGLDGQAWGTQATRTAAGIVHIPRPQRELDERRRVRVQTEQAARVANER